MQNQEYGTNNPVGRAQDWAAEKAESATDQVKGLRDKVTHGIESAAHQVKEQVDSTVSYFREHDAKAVMNDLTSYVKSHPTQALIGAAIVGFIAGRLVRRP